MPGLKLLFLIPLTVSPTIFDIDISRDNENLRMIIRNIAELDKVFSNEKLKINLYLSKGNCINMIDSLISPSNASKNDIFIFVNKNQKLVSLNFSKNYEINSYSYLDQLYDSNKIDYSLEIL